ncbi:MAG TPA: dihydrofolate reductase family protein [Candidatus Polarisedimenticolaceae bacterium]|nr:dihydrofolate reductase family protein [Candidatus Polarisedimenticolaceae bacterium]
MRNVVYSVAMSLDGYVAGPNGEADWIVMDPEIDFRSLMARFDTILMGRKTFDAAQAMGGGGSMPGMKSIVVSKTLRQADNRKLTIIGEDLGGTVSRLRAESGKDIWLFGGGTLFRSLLDLKLVDRVEVAVIPVLLGGGIPLLPAGAGRMKLRLSSSKAYKATGTVALEYIVEGV